MKEKYNINRKDFLKLTVLTFLMPYFQKLEQKGELETPPMTNLPILFAQNTPLFIEHLTRGYREINFEYEENELFHPNWITASDMPIDILPNTFRPEPDLQVPGLKSDYLPWLVSLPHITGLQPIRVSALLCIQKRDGSSHLLPKPGLTIKAKSKSDIVATHAFTDRIRIYPNKIYNILTALLTIREWQEQNGPLLPGNTYSYLEMSGAPRRNKDRFIVGGSYEAGGICASVTTLSKTVLILNTLGYSEYVARSPHEPEIQYAENLLEPGITKINSDATVGWSVGSPDLYEHNKDFRFRLLPDSPPLYLSFGAHLDTSETIDFSGKWPRRSIYRDGTRLTFTVSFYRKKPQDSEAISKIIQLQKEYGERYGF